MEEDGLIQNHFPEAECDPGGAAEDEGIDDPHVGGKLPDKEEA